MDYKLLLKKYIDHVGQEEGTTFINRLRFGQSSDVDFTDDEILELVKLDRLTEREWNERNKL